MRKFLSVFLCVALLCLSFPGLVLAQDTAKQAFISTCLGNFDKSLQIQQPYLQALPQNTIKFDLAADLTDINIDLDDGAKISYPAGKATITMAFNVQDKQGSLEFNGQLGKQDIHGQIFLDKNGLIVPRSTIISLANNGADFSEWGDLNALPEYLVYSSPLYDVMFEAMQQSFQEESLNKQMAFAKLLIKDLLQIIPDECYVYSGSGIGLDLTKIDFSSPELLSNIKQYGTEITETFIASMNKPSTISDAQFQELQNQMRTEMLKGIENLTTEELVRFTQQIPVSIQKFQFYLSSDGQENSMIIQCAVTPINTDIMATGQGKMQIGSNKIDSQQNNYLSINSPYLQMHLTIDSNSAVDVKGISFTSRLSGDLSADKKMSMSGVLNLIGSYDWSGQNSIAIPEITAKNSKKAAFPDSPVQVRQDNMVLPGLNPMMIKGSAIVQARDLANALGCSIVWQDPDTIIISNGSKAGDLVMHIGSADYQIGDNVYEMANAPFTMMDKAYVPLRPVAQYCGLTVDWDPIGRCVTLKQLAPMH